MRILPIAAENPDPTAIQAAAAVLRDGGLVAFPTETVYGLGGNALDLDAVARIYAVKGRPSFNPLIVHCADLEAARALALDWPEAADRLASHFWPGALTLVVRKRDVVPDRVTAGLSTVALRVPSHPVAEALLRLSRLPIAAPSANRYTELSPTTADHVLKGLRGRIDLVLDAGPSPLGIESTVVDLSGDRPILLRPGSIATEEVTEQLGIEIGSAGAYGDREARPAPGMLARHYTPRAKLVLIEGKALATLAEEAAGSGARIGALLLGDARSPAIHRAVRMPTNPALYARALYATLHELDDEGCDLILVENVPTGGPWTGVRDRLARAATAG